MDPELRGRIRAFHLRVTLLGGILMVAASLAAAYIVFLRQSPEVPAFLNALARFVAGARR